MPHRIKHRGAHAVDRHVFAGGKPNRFRFAGTVKHRGRLVKQRLGFRGPSRVVEVAYFPLRR